MSANAGRSNGRTPPANKDNHVGDDPKGGRDLNGWMQNGAADEGREQRKLRLGSIHRVFPRTVDAGSGSTEPFPIRRTIAVSRPLRDFFE
jgi:hypothetical protein